MRNQFRLISFLQNIHISRLRDSERDYVMYCFRWQIEKIKSHQRKPQARKPRLATGFCFACFFFHFCVRTTLRGVPIFSKTFSRKFSFHSTLLPECLEFSVEWFVFRKFNSFGISRNFSGKFLFHLKLFPNV